MNNEVPCTFCIHKSICKHEMGFIGFLTDMSNWFKDAVENDSFIIFEPPRCKYYKPEAMIRDFRKED